jgi:hypothetical protein
MEPQEQDPNSLIFVNAYFNLDDVLRNGSASSRIVTPTITTLEANANAV